MKKFIFYSIAFLFVVVGVLPSFNNHEDAWADISFPIETSISGTNAVNAINQNHTQLAPVGVEAIFNMITAPNGWYKMDGVTWHTRNTDKELFTRISSLLVTTNPTFITTTSFKLWKVNVGYDGYARLSDVKSNNTNGGTFTAGSWQTRDLNTEYDPEGFVNLSGNNQFILDSGTYKVSFIAPAYKCDQNKARLQNISTAATPIIGTSTYDSNASVNSQIYSHGYGEVTVGTYEPLELQHRCLTTSSTNGLGVASNFGVNEVYSIVEIWRKRRGITCIKR